MEASQAPLLTLARIGGLVQLLGATPGVGLLGAYAPKRAKMIMAGRWGLTPLKTSPQLTILLRSPPGYGPV